MKPRTVYVTLEVESDAPLKYLGDLKSWTTRPWSEHEMALTTLIHVRGAVARVAQPAGVGPDRMTGKPRKKKARNKP